MQTLIAIAIAALTLFGPGWSSEHKAFWEWNLGRPLEGYEEHRLARGWRLDGNGPLLKIQFDDQAENSSFTFRTDFGPVYIDPGPWIAPLDWEPPEIDPRAPSEP